MNKRFPGMRFSFARLFIAITVLVALVAVIAGGVGYQIQALKPVATPWSGGYVDVTETPAFEFESQTGIGQDNVVLAFVVASQESCKPSWGNYYSLQAANHEMDLDRRIAQVQKSGRTVVLSFGGRDNTDLAMACGDTESLRDALATAIDRYQVGAVDFDIEGDDLTDVAGRARRAQAVARLQSEMQEDGRDLAVWITLPADREGLTNDGLAVVNEFLNEGVNLAGVNLMTMNFGVSSSEVSMATLSEEAARAAHGQLTRTLIASGRIVTGVQVWSMLGVTPMVGQNDERDEVFTINDAIALHTFAQTHNVGRVSFWSLNRDRQCDANYTDWRNAANFCSGVNQETLEFAAILGSDRGGDANQLPDSTVTTPQSYPEDTSVKDDPATSPYPIWAPSITYNTGDKVVWRRNVYVALWVNRDYEPDQARQDANSAWRLVGPVLEGEEPRPLPTLPQGVYPTWDPLEIYDTGDRVTVRDVGYEAKWWTQGDSPAEALLVDDSPWRQLTEEEVEQVLSEGE